MMNLTAKQKVLLNHIYNGEVEDYDALDKRTINALESKGLIGVTKMNGSITDIGVLTPALEHVNPDHPVPENHSSTTPEVLPDTQFSESLSLNVGSLTANNVLQYKEFFENWKPLNKTQAIQMKYLQYFLNGAKKNIDAVCAEEFDSIQDLGTEFIDSQTGLRLIRRKKSGKKTYNVTEDVIEADMEVTYIQEKIREATAELEAELEEAQERLQKAKDEAGFTQEEDSYTYAVKI